MSIDSQLLAQATLFHPMSFLTRTPEKAAEKFLQDLEAEVASSALIELTSADGLSSIYYRGLAWDTEYFGVPMYRIDFSVVRTKASRLCSHTANCSGC